MAILIDGYNLLFTVGLPRGAGGPRQLEEARFSLLDFLVLKLLPKEVAVTTIVFDAKQSRGDDGSRFDHRGITVRFAYEQEEADDLLEILIAADPHPDRLLVVTSDRRVQTAAMRRNAEVIGSEAWLEQLQSRVDAGTSEVSVQKSRDDPRQHQPDSDETQRWLDEFREAEQKNVGDARLKDEGGAAEGRDAGLDSPVDSTRGKRPDSGDQDSGDQDSGDQDSGSPTVDRFDPQDPTWDPFPPGYGEDLG